jgi:hypothetical protein
MEESTWRRFVEKARGESNPKEIQDKGAGKDFCGDELHTIIAVSRHVQWERTTGKLGVTCRHKIQGSVGPRS